MFREARSKRILEKRRRIIPLLDQSISALIRSTSGKLALHIANDATDPFSAGDWTAAADVSSGPTVSGSNGRLLWSVANDADAEGNLMYDPAGTLSQMMVQARILGAHSGASAGFFIGVATLLDTNAINGVVLRSELLDQDRVVLRDEQAASSIATGTDAKVENTGYSFSIFADRVGAEAEAYDFNDGVVLSGAIPGTHSSDQKPGLVAAKAGDAECGRFFLHNDKDLIVNNLPEGAKAQLRDSGDSVLKEAGESAGTATINCVDVWMRDAVDLVIESSSGQVLERETPSDGLWGGDVYDAT